MIKIYTCENVPILKANVYLPSFNEEKIDRLFSKINSQVSEFLDNNLYPEICRKYSEAIDSKKKYRFRYYYVLTVTEIFRSENYLSILINANLKNKNGSENKISYIRHLVFRLSDQKLIPYEAITRYNFRKKYHREGFRDFCLSGENLCFFKPDGTEIRYTLPE